MSRGMVIGLVIVVVIVGVFLAVGGGGLSTQDSGEVAPHALQPQD